MGRRESSWSATRWDGDERDDAEQNTTSRMTREAAEDTEQKWSMMPTMPMVPMQQDTKTKAPSKRGSINGNGNGGGDDDGTDNDSDGTDRSSSSIKPQQKHSKTPVATYRHPSFVKP